MILILAYIIIALAGVMFCSTLFLKNWFAVSGWLVVFISQLTIVCLLV